MSQKFYAVRVVVTDSHGHVHMRDYVRGDRHIGEQRFMEESVGNLVGMLSYFSEDQLVSEVRQIRVFDITPQEVEDRRLEMSRW